MTIKLDKTGPSAALAVTAGTLGANGWYTSDVTIGTSGTDISTPVTCTDDQSQTTETTGTAFDGSCTNNAGLTTNADQLTVKLDKTGPSAVLAVTAGTAGANGWYISNVTIGTSGTDSISTPVTCTADQIQSAETTGITVNGSCTNAAGLSTDAASLTVKLDKTGPSAALAVTAGTLGANGWYISNVTIGTSGTDSISSPVTCTLDQSQTTETTGTAFNGSCTNAAGLSTDAASLTVKLDKTGPSAVLAVTAGTAGANGWYISDVTVSTSGTDSISTPVACTDDQYQNTETAGAAFNGSCTNDAGLSTDAAPITIKLDKFAPVLDPSVTPNPVVLNGSATASAGATDAMSGVASQSCDPVITSSVGIGKTVQCTAADNAGNSASAPATYSVIYAVGGLCLGSPGHQILQPINSDGTSVFKKGSTSPAKFRVCDANGASIGTSGVVFSFRLTMSTNGTISNIDEAVISTTPDSAFRWSGSDQQWIFNINTKNLIASRTYLYRITLNDGTFIDFQFGLK
jgi:hypothetical protein